jgi:hypothetical protein
MALHTRLTEMLGIEHPIISAPMAFAAGGNSKVAIELSVWIFLSRHDHLADRPQRYSSKFQMCPSERDAHYGNSEENCGDEMP